MFFANSQDRAVDTKVLLRGKKNLAVWDPHTGERRAAEGELSELEGQPVTRVRLALPAVSSVFLVSE